MGCDLLIVGASFAGLACARAAALAGLQVTVLEKKAAAGEKLHTTGIIVKDAVDSIEWLRELPPHLVRPIEAVRLYAPNLRYVDLYAPGYYFLATDTPNLLNWMIDSVQGLGVQVRLATLFENASYKGRAWEVPLSTGEMLTASYLVGADGPHSRVAKALGLSCNEHFLFGVEHEYEKVRLQENFLHCFITRQLAPGYIGWAFAGVGVTQIGLARRMPKDTAGPGSRQVAINTFLERISAVIQPADSPLSVRAGMIPCGGVLKKVAKAGALLVGDAAGMVSPVTAGGIHTALYHGAQAGEGIAAFLLGKAEDPAYCLVRQYPHFRSKRVLRWLFDHLQSDWMFNQLLGTTAMRHAAERIYFHRKGAGRS